MERFRHIPPGSKIEPEAAKVFAIKEKDGSSYRFHIGQYRDFIKLLDASGVPATGYTLNHIKKPVTEDIVLNVNNKRKLRPEQETAADFCFKETEYFDLNSRLIEMPTGTGKTVTGLTVCSRLSKKLAIIVLPTYIDKWCSDVLDNLDIKSSEVMAITGSKQIAGLIQAAKEGGLKKIKVFIFSLNSFNNFTKAFEDSREEFREYFEIERPSDIFGLIGAGTLLIDEAHQHLHMVYRALLNTHIERLIALSATFTHDDRFLMALQKLLFPAYIRFDKIEMKKYINVIGVAYNIDDIKSRKIKTTPWGRNTYSHVEFEKSILKSGKLTKNYITLIKDVIDVYFIRKRQDGDKLAVYASTIDMCSVICDYLKSVYSDLDIRTYNQGDPYENVIESDIRVTTVISAGTAIDISGLTMVLLTNSLNSSVSNLQLLGRLREIKDREVYFIYLYCDQIPKHVEYHRNKVYLFTPKSKYIRTVRYDKLL
jgi:superfamily II DNA or RNA helicase